MLPEEIAMAMTSQIPSHGKLPSFDPIWSEIRNEAEEAIRAEPALGGFIFPTVLSHARPEDAVCHRLAQRLNHSDVDSGLIGQIFQDVLQKRPDLGRAFRADVAAVHDRDPACSRYIY